MLRFLFVLLALGLAAPSATAQITFEPLPVAAEDEAPEFPIQGRPVRITLDEPADAVKVVWRPNSAIPDTVALDAAGSSFVWTPSRAGVATIQATSGEATVSQNVSVRYAGFPASGIFILIVAATILFGGAGFAMGKLLGGESPAPYQDLMPDT
ncbi:MAG: hypothetical protein HKN04_01000 [Rhodothermaceae bacterium]|nr:hypothetical protein [Rhodothermaceae bacterium]